MNPEESKEKLLHAMLAEDARLPESAPDTAFLERVSAEIDVEIQHADGDPPAASIARPPLWKRPGVQSAAAACVVFAGLIGAAVLIKAPSEDLAILDADKIGGKSSPATDSTPPFKVKFKEQKEGKEILADMKAHSQALSADALPTPESHPLEIQASPVPVPTESLAQGQSEYFGKMKAIEVTDAPAKRDASVGLSLPSSADILPEKRRERLIGQSIPSGGLHGRAARTSRYAPLTDQPFKSPAAHPLSTFSIDTDRASYTQLRNSLNRGLQIHPDSVRIEEMINAFQYNYEAPRGDHPFSVHVETAASPWNTETRLVKIGLQGKEIARESRPATNLVLLCDVSGSMNAPNKLGYLKASFMELIENLDERDTVSIVTYAGSEGVALQPTKADAAGRPEIFKAIEKMRSGGSTNGEAGIKLAYSLANKNFLQDGVNRVLLATDGDFNIGVTGDEELLSVVKKGAKKGTFLTVLGFGHNNLNDGMLEKITNDGNGQYFFVDSRQEGRRVFTRELTGTLVTIAKDVKIQVEFNPAEVAEYRLLGYANRQLKAEDFNNDRVDAGEIGSGHTVTAFYEVIPGAALPAVDNLKYASPPPLERGKRQPRPTRNKERVSAEEEVSAAAEMLTVKLRYKEPQGTRSTLIEQAVIDNGNGFQSASADFRFASSVALYGMLLRDSTETGGTDFTTVEELASDALMGQKDRKEFLELVQKTPR